MISSNFMKIIFYCVIITCTKNSLVSLLNIQYTSVEIIKAICHERKFAKSYRYPYCKLFREYSRMCIWSFKNICREFHTLTMHKYFKTSENLLLRNKKNVRGIWYFILVLRSFHLRISIQTENLYLTIENHKRLRYQKGYVAVDVRDLTEEVLECA